MALPFIQQAFSAGEISPELYGEVSLAKYQSAATTIRNMVINYKGGVFSRGGLAFVGVSLQTTYLRLGTSTGPPRPIPFQYNITQGYILEFGDNYLRFIFQGGYVLETPVSISGASQADPCAISVTGMPFNNGDWVYASGIGGMTQLNGKTFIVANSTSGSFTLEDLQGNAVDSTAYTAYTSGGSFARLYTVSTPYAAVDLPYLKVAQSADLMSLTCSNPVTGTEYPPYDLTRLAAADWTLQQTDFDPVISPPTSVTAYSTAAAPSSGVNASFGYVVTAVDANGNESIASSVAYCNGADIEVEGGSNIVSWGNVQGASYYNVYRSPAATNSGATINYPPAGSIMGFVGSAYGTQFSDTQSTVDLTQTAPTHQNPFARGQILAVVITGAGTGQTTVTWAITTATGSNFAGYPVVIGGSLGAFPIVNNGEGYEPGDSIAFNGAGFASGAIEFGTTNPHVNDTVQLNGVVWTFVSAITGVNQTIIGGSLADTLRGFVGNLAASANPLISCASYAIDSSNSNLLITFNTAGTGGNAYTLNASRATPSGANLTGGSGSGAMGAHASGTLTFVGNPTNGQTIVLDGVTWTFVTSGATGNQTNLGVNLAATLTQLASDLTASVNTSIALATYSVTTTVLTINYKTAGIIGNNYTLGGGTYGATTSASTLLGGADAATTPTGTLTIGPETGTYPGVNAYFQQRHFFANSFNDPDTFWASQTDKYTNFDTSTPTVATDAITASPWTEQVNGIQWLIPMPGGLIAMTGSRAWQILGQGSYQLNVQPVTPSTTQAQPQAFNGCSATLPPIVIDYDVLYVEAVGNTIVRDLSWNFWVNIYTGADLTILSSHLFLYRQIVQWTWARNPYKVVWAACNDGTLLSMTYLKEQEVYGWARHDTQGLVVGIASVTEPPVNAVYVSVLRYPPYAPNGIYTLERMDNRIWQSVEDAFSVDSAVSNPMATPNALLYASSVGNAVHFGANASVFNSGYAGVVIRMGGGIALVTSYSSPTSVYGTWVVKPPPGPLGANVTVAVSGNWTAATPVLSLSAPHLAGMTVNALADGVPLTGLTVGSDGTIPLPFLASDVKGGLSFTAQLQTPYLNGQQTLQGSRKIIPAATFRLSASATEFQVGTNQPDGAAQNPPQFAPPWTNLATGNTLDPTGGQNSAGTYLSPSGQTVTQLWTGDLRVIGSGAEWNSKGQVAIQQTLPVALEVTAVMPERLEGDLPEEAIQERQAAQQQARGPGRWQLGAPRI